MKKGIFGRLSVIYAAVLIASLALAEVYITRVVRESYIEGLKDSLRVQASLIAEGISFNAGVKETGPLAESLKKKTGARVTIIEGGGRVLGDSDEDAPLMDNHAGRPEIRQALYAGSGSAIRHSDTLGQDFLYVAVEVPGDAGEGGFVRLAVPLNRVNSSVNRIRFELFLIVLLALSATGAFHMWQTLRLRRLTLQVAEFSGAIVRGNFGRRLFFEGMGEFSEIAQNLNAMSEELKSSIEEGREEKNRLGVILRSVPDALLIIGQDDTIALSSSASSGLFGNPPLRGRPYTEVVRSHEFSEIVAEARGGQKPLEREMRLDLPEETYLVVRVSPLYYKETELSGVLAIFHDITRMKKLEQVRKDFVANVSHEIRTPVASIRGYAETLLEGAIDDRENAMRFLRTIKSNSERLNAIVEDLLTISRLEVGAMKVEKSDVDLGESIRHVIAMLGGRISDKGLDVKLALDPGAANVMADRNRLIQVLTNLMDNAIKFTDKGTITVKAERQEGQAVVSVEDTGIGVPRKYLPRLGERFFRVDPSRSRAMGGTGLGLAIVKHIVKAHGWRMQIESFEGHGTSVRIIIPA